MWKLSTKSFFTNVISYRTKIILHVTYSEISEDKYDMSDLFTFL